VIEGFEKVICGHPEK